MKATINGITYEGTYDEITAIVDRMTPRIQNDWRGLTGIEMNDYGKYVPVFITTGSKINEFT